jgi:hypothetical protein
LLPTEPPLFDENQLVIVVPAVASFGFLPMVSKEAINCCSRLPF